MTIDPARPIRWGILGTGWIASEFAGDLALLDDAELVAVGSRSQATADAFGARFGLERCYSTYADLVADPEVDAVYVCSPHPMHAAHALLAIQAGKAVFCEKPFTLNAAQAREVVAAAQAQRHLPDGGDVDPLAATHGQDPLAARGRGTRPGARGLRRPRPVVRLRPGVSALRPRAGRWGAAGPRRLSGVVRLDGAGRPLSGRRDQRTHADRRRRADLDPARASGRRSGRA